MKKLALLLVLTIAISSQSPLQAMGKKPGHDRPHGHKHHHDHGHDHKKAVKAEGKQSQAALNKMAPNFTLVSDSGRKVSLSDFKGKYVVLEWTNHGCPYVKKHYKSNNMQSLQKKYTDQGVVWLSIISSAPGKQGHVSAKESRELTEDRNATPTFVLFDPQGKVGRKYAAKTTPHMYIIDRNGQLVYRGAIDSDPSASAAAIPSSTNYVSQGLDELLSGNPVSVSNTKPYGCSVKYN